MPRIPHGGLSRMVPAQTEVCDLEAVEARTGAI